MYLNIWYTKIFLHQTIFYKKRFDTREFILKNKFLWENNLLEISSKEFQPCSSFYCLTVCWLTGQDKYDKGMKKLRGGREEERGVNCSARCCGPLQPAGLEKKEHNRPRLIGKTSSALYRNTKQYSSIEYETLSKEKEYIFQYLKILLIKKNTGVL